MSHELKSLLALHQLRSMQRDQIRLRQQSTKQVLDTIDKRIDRLLKDVSTADTWFAAKSRTALNPTELEMLSSYTAQLHGLCKQARSEKDQILQELSDIATQLTQAQLAVDQADFRRNVLLRERSNEQRARDWRDADEWQIVRGSLGEAVSHEN